MKESRESPPSGVDFPPAIRIEIERALGASISRIVRPEDGTQGRTFLIGNSSHEWIARLHRGPNPQMKRSFLAQQRARAAGMRTPRVLAYSFSASEDGEYDWTVEERISGKAFAPESSNLALAADVGRQLRLLHEVEVTGFGDFQTDRFEARHSTFNAWVAERESSIAAAVGVARLDPGVIGRIEQAYRLLGESYPETARLCHGDFSPENLLVEGERLAAVIDWEMACGGDPALDLAYCSFWSTDAAILDALIEGYQPTDGAALRQRIRAHFLLYAVDLTVWLEEAGASGQECYRRWFAYNRQRFQDLLSELPQPAPTQRRLREATVEPRPNRDTGWSNFRRRLGARLRQALGKAQAD
ncbi:MAG: aminoglycoside phosphotransferase family protein [Blastocatellales bacterium]|nr:aminoglycoside phosphotransferase family protein [Blastocatellales bacterium]